MLITNVPQVRHKTTLQKKTNKQKTPKITSHLQIILSSIGITFQAGCKLLLSIKPIVQTHGDQALPKPTRNDQRWLKLIFFSTRK